MRGDTRRKMTREKGQRPKSPIHVHTDDVPVHVHVRKSKKKSGAKASGSSHRLMRPTASSRARARSVSPSPPSGPWVPSPGKATKGGRVTWKAPHNKLEVNQIRHSDLSTDDEERAGSQVRNYEKKINTLMNEVGTLKNEVVLQKALQEIEHKEDLLNSSSRLIEKQEVELQNVEEELAVTETENKILRESMHRVQDQVEITKMQTIEHVESDDNISSQPSSENPISSNEEDSESLVEKFSPLEVMQFEIGSEKDILNYEREKLMKKLIEAEMDGQAAAQQVRELKEAMRRVRDDQFMTHNEQARLAKHKQQFLQTLTDFESSNRTLRHLLRDHHRLEASGLRLTEQRDVLLKKLADGDVSNERLRKQLLECESLIADLRNQLQIEKEERLAMCNLQGSLESTRAHLQKQLRTKEGDCNRMAVQIRSLEGQLAQERIEKDQMHETVSTSRERVDRDKEALKKAARAQKSRAEKLEDELSRLTLQLTEAETRSLEANSRINSNTSKLDRLEREREKLLEERDVLKTRIGELESLLDRVEENAKGQNEALTTRLHEKMSENTTLRLENERLKNNTGGADAKLKQAEEDLQQMRTTIKQYEKLIDEYKEQADRKRSEADESFIKLEEQSRENERLARDGEVELEKMKARLQQRLQELEPLPELLRSTELRLHEANEKILAAERNNADSVKTIAELSAKLEFNVDALDQVRSKFHESQDSNHSLQTRYDSLERKMKEIEGQNLELHSSVARNQEAIHTDSLQLEEKSRENASLTRQLENALSDNRKLAEQARDRYSSKERTYQSRIVDLETQLSQIRAEQARVKREKEESERRFNSRLYDLKDRLEQSHSTNRSMQNYVQFLKNSYANVFGDSSVSFPAPPSPLKPYP